MNQSQPIGDFLTTDEASLMSADVAGLMDDTTLSVSISYRDVGAPTFTPSTGAMTANETAYAIRAIRNVVSTRELAAALGKFQQGDVRYLIARSDLTITPSREDRIVDSDDTYELIDWNTDPLRLVWRVYARKVA